MLDELKDLFLTALRFDGDDAMPLVTRWNEAVKRVQAVFDNMTDKTVDAVPVVRCKDCKHGSKCTMNMIQCKMYDRFHRADWFCANGERKGGTSDDRVYNLGGLHV